MDWLAMLSAFVTLGLFCLVGAVAAWAWREEQYLLAVPLTIIFGAAAVGIVMYLNRFGGV